MGDIPGGLVVRILHFHCRGPKLDPISNLGTNIPKVAGHGQKKKKKKKSGTISSTRDVQVYLAPAQRVHTVRLDRQEARFALLEEALASRAASSPFYKWEN